MIFYVCMDVDVDVDWVHLTFCWSCLAAWNFGWRTPAWGIVNCGGLLTLKMTSDPEFSDVVLRQVLTRLFWKRLTKRLNWYFTCYMLLGSGSSDSSPSWGRPRSTISEDESPCLGSKVDVPWYNMYIMYIYNYIYIYYNIILHHRVDMCRSSKGWRGHRGPVGQSSSSDFPPRQVDVERPSLDESTQRVELRWRKWGWWNWHQM